MWADLDSDRCMGGSRPNQNDYVFVILVKHLKSCIETTDHREFGGKPSNWSEDGCYREKIPEFCSVGEARSKNSIFRVFGVPFDCPAHSLQETVTVILKKMVPMESRDSGSVPFASLESL